MRLRTILVTLFALGALQTSCESDEPHRTHARGRHGLRSSALLRPIAGCDDLVATRKAEITERMNANLDASLAYAIGQIEQPEQYCYWTCGYIDGEVDVDVPCYAAGAESDANAPPGADPSRGASEYTTTNNQVAGVDEADLVKNDGQYIYMVSGSSFLVLGAWPAVETRVLAEVALPGPGAKLQISGDRALVYSQAGSCAGAYDASPSAGLVISIFDIADRAAPQLERELTLGGALVASRRIGDAVHTAASFAPREPAFSTWPAELPWWLCDDASITRETVEQSFEALRAENLALIVALTVADFVPAVVDRDLRGGSEQVQSGLFDDCERFFAPTTSEQRGLLSVISVDITDDQSFSAATILGQGGDVYASAGSLYVASHEWVASSDPYGYGGGEERTVLHKFALAGASAEYRASGLVPGRLVNQFAMDEHQGDLRVATSWGELWSGTAENALYVLRERAGDDCDEPAAAPRDAEEEPCGLGAELAVIGELEGLAAGEDIRAARFDGERGFLVTFKKTDPLFAFDLSQPEAPRATGELHIPGFSTYMHFLDDQHLLTIGFDAADQGSFAWFTGIQLQVFDVTDPAALRLVHKETIGTRGTTSDATDDHLAFNFFRGRDLLAIPMGICEGGNQDGGYGSTMTFNGLMLYRVTVAGGFEYLGGVDHRDPLAPADPYGYGCYNWWQTPNSQVKRSILMAEGEDVFAYSLSAAQLKVSDLAALGTDLVSIALPQAESCY